MRRQSIALALICLLGLSACKREPDFAERYDAASKQLGSTAKEIDVELEKRSKAVQPGAAAPSPDDSGVQNAGSVPDIGP